MNGHRPLGVRHHLNALRTHRNRFLPDTEKTADIDDIGFNLAVLIEKNVADLADLGIVGDLHLGADELFLR